MTSKRQKAREQRRHQFWADKTARAGTAAAQAAVAWDQLRATIGDLDRAAADQAWQGVTITLRHVARELPTAGRASEPANAQPRAGARETTTRSVT